MPRYVLPLLIAAAVVIALVLTWWTLGRTSISGEAATVERDVEPFHAVEVSGAGEVVLRHGDKEHVSVETPVHGARVVADVRKGTLYLSVRDSRRWWSALLGRSRGGTVRVTVSYRDVDTIALSGAVQLSAAALETPALRIAASGGSSVRLDNLSTRALRLSGDGALKADVSGEATDQRVSISGAGAYNAPQLASDHASIDVSGVGHVVVRVAKTLKASISGAGSIEYYGDPQVEQHVSGVGRVTRREAAAPLHESLHIAAWPLVALPGACAAVL
jgi:hypothetical protein